MREYTPGYIEESPEEQEKAALTITRMLNRVPLIARREIVEMMRKKLILADTSEIGFNFCAIPLDTNNRWLVFVASRLERRKRIEITHKLCYCIVLKMHAKTAVGIATENMHRTDGRSFDYLLLDYAEIPHDPETEADMDKIFGNLIPMRLYDFPHENRRIIVP